MGQASRRNKILQPLSKLGIDKIADMEDVLKRQFGEEEASRITEEWNRLSRLSDSSGTPGSQTALYDFLHHNPELSMLVTSYTDAAILREFCYWIYEHQELFGMTVLDVGCGTGILTCFLGLLLPSSKILAIDRSANCIRTAEWVKEKMKAENVTFQNISLEELEDRQFHTVLSVRTFHENIGVRKTENLFLPFSEQIKINEEIYQNYCRRLSSFVLPGGRLVCIERNRVDTEFYSILRLLNSFGLQILPEEMRELSCSESDFAEKSVFQTFAARKLMEECTECMTEEELFSLWKERAFSKSDDPEYYTRCQADWFTEKEADGLIEGYTTYNEEGTQLAKACLLNRKNTLEQFLMYQANYHKAGVKILPMEALDEAKEVFRDHIAVDAARGFRVERSEN